MIPIWSELSKHFNDDDTKLIRTMKSQSIYSLIMIYKGPFRRPLTYRPLEFLDIERTMLTFA